MDEREVRDVLRGAADSVEPNADLSARAERRYRRRRARGRVLASAVAIAVVGSGVVVAASIGNHRSNQASPPPSSSPAPVTGTVDVSEIGSMTFIDAERGYGVEHERYLARSTDGGHTWQRVGLMPEGARYVMFAPEYAKSLTGLVAWGNGSLSQSSDGGAHWHATLGPQVGAVLEASFRLWATVVCGPGVPAPCTPRLVTSTDAGRTWTDSPTCLDLGTGARAIAIPSGNTLYLVDGEFAWTPDGGRSWAHHPEPAECATRPVADLVVEAGVLFLVCSPGSLADGVGSRAFFSIDQGGSWQPTAPLPAGNSVYGPAVSATDAGFLVATDRGVRATTDNGSSWHDAFPLPAGTPIAAIDREFGVGVWVAAGDQGIWFSPDGAHWEQRATAGETATTVPTTTVGLTDVDALSFVDANVGFGLVADGHGATSDAVRTDDGGRTWRRVGVLGEVENFVHFENASDGVAWGTGPLELTTDGGAHWTATSGPVDNSLAWSEGRLWGMTPCVQSTPCGSRPVLISDDAGRTWQRTAPLRLGFGGIDLLATSRSTAYVAEPATDQQPGPWQLALTADGGASWTYRPAPCATWAQSPYLAATDNLLLLVCAGEPGAGNQMKQVWTSSDRGLHWSAGDARGLGGYVGVLTNVGSTFVAAMGRGDVLSSTDGASWHVEIPNPGGEGGWLFDRVPGIGVWAAINRPVEESGLWFSADGAHWARQ